MAHGCQSSPACAEKGPQLSCPTAWGGHSSSSGKSSRKKQSHAGLACSTRPGSRPAGQAVAPAFTLLGVGSTCWKWLDSQLHVAAQEVQSCPVKGAHNPPSVLCAVPSPQGAVCSPCAHGENLRCSPDHEHSGRGWVLD